MSDPVPLLTEPTCRTLSVRQAPTVLSLTVAAVEELPETPLDRRRSATARVSATLSDLGLLVVDEPELAAAYSSAMLAERRRRPTDDLTTALVEVEVEVEVDGDRLTDDEIISFLFLMVVAGNETTTKLLGNAWYWAWRHPEQQASVLAAPESVPAWVEETLRYDTSTQMLARTTTRDVELHEQHVPSGERIVLLIGSANRDPRVFEDPDRYDLERAGDQSQQSVSFGFGRHFCLGASLARLEARVALEELVTRVRSYELHPDGIARVHSINVRGFAALPATLVPR